MFNKKLFFKIIFTCVVMSMVPEFGWGIEYSADLKNALPRHNPNFKVSTYANIQQKIHNQIVGDYTKRPGLETGGDLYGEFDQKIDAPKKTFLIKYATGPGPHAVFHGGATFPDLYLTRLFGACIAKHPTIKFTIPIRGATWHSHHTMHDSYPGPSGIPEGLSGAWGDLDSITNHCSVFGFTEYLIYIAHIFPPNETTINAYTFETHTMPGILNYWHIGSNSGFSKIPCKCPAPKSPIPFNILPGESPDVKSLTLLENLVISYLQVLKDHPEKIEMLKTVIKHSGLTNILDSGESLLHVLCQSDVFKTSGSSDKDASKKIEYFTLTLKAAQQLDLINKKNSNQHTPLHIAVFGNKLDVIKLLIDAGANVDIQDKFGKTPLLYVVSLAVATTNLSQLSDTKTMITLLKNAGANIDITDNTGKSARILAQEKAATKPDILALLTAKPSVVIPPTPPPANKKPIDIKEEPAIVPEKPKDIPQDKQKSQKSMASLIGALEKLSAKLKQLAKVLKP